MNQTIAELRLGSAPPAQERALWRAIREEFAAQITDLADPEFTKTFFSSISRRLFGTVGVAPDIEFVATDLDPLADIHSAVGTNTYVNHGSLPLLFEDLLGMCASAPPGAISTRASRTSPTRCTRYLHASGERREIDRVEVIRPVFYQISRAYVVGRLVGRGFLVPLVIALKNGDGGVLVDAVMLAEDDVSIVFSFTRSYFHVDLERVAEAVVFLKSIMPRKPVSELFTVLGRARQGKTERYRELMRNLEHTQRSVRARPRRARAGDGVLHAALLRCGLQGDPRPLPLPEDGAARGGDGQVPHGLHPRPRRAAGGCAGISPAALSARALRARVAAGAARAKRPARCTRTARTLYSTTCTSSGA